MTETMKKCLMALNVQYALIFIITTIYLNYNDMLIVVADSSFRHDPSIRTELHDRVHENNSSTIDTILKASKQDKNDFRSTLSRFMFPFLQNSSEKSKKVNENTYQDFILPVRNGGRQRGTISTSKTSDISINPTGGIQSTASTNDSSFDNDDEETNSDDDQLTSKKTGKFDSSSIANYDSTTQSSNVINNPISDISSLIAIACKTHITPQRVLNLSITGIQFGICYYIAKSIWKAIVDIMEEVEREMNNGSNSSHMKEEHDLPFLSEENIDLSCRNAFAALNAVNANKEEEEENNQIDKGRTSPTSIKTKNSIQDKRTNNNKRIMDPDTSSLPSKDQNNPSNNIIRTKQQIQPSTLTSNLAMRLSASGLPFVSSSDPNSNVKSVPSVLKSLTRTEGQLLSNILLSPIDTHEHGLIHGSSDRNNRVIQMWNEIGGLDDVKEALLDLVFPFLISSSQMSNNLLNNDDDFANEERNQYPYYGGLLNNPPGVLLYGPPGCGKTMLVRALAHTANARFLCVTPSSLLRKYVGETNLNVRALFSLARKVSPCIIFIDEMEGLFRERGGTGGGGEEHEVNRELKTEFMQLWDGIQTIGSGNEQILVVGATNRPFDLDSAFLRRMPRSFFVGLPDFSSRKAILQTILKNVPLSKDFDFDAVAGVTEEFSPSDMKELLRTAALIPLREARAVGLRQQQLSSKNDISQQPIEIPRLRHLMTSDVMQARARVNPTQFSPQYRAALIDYTMRASGGRTRLDRFENNAYQSHDERNHFTSSNGEPVNGFQTSDPIGNGMFFTHSETVAGTGRNDPSYEQNSDDSMSSSYEEDYDASSFDDD